MFFSPELLERRDSGYGLLWLAATLGAKSSFSKLPKRSVITADISQLCGLIAEPSEPLALRLSSNLMIGVARVYKVKQDIFLADVTTCFNSLKKASQSLSALVASSAQLQMGQPSLRAEALTLVADPGAAFGINFDSIFAIWEEQLDLDIEEFGSDDEFDPKARSKSKGKQKQKDVSISAAAEHARALHTLDEDHTPLLAAAFEASLGGSVQGGPGFAASSSQVDAGFGFDDNLFDMPDGAAGADIGDELARELGEGWGASAFEPGLGGRPSDLGQQATALVGLGFGDDFQFDVQPDIEMRPPEDVLSRSSLPPSGSAIGPLGPVSPRGSEDLLDIQKPVQRKGKRVRLDARTELTDEELKMARANYVQEQEALGREIAQKKLQQHNSKLIEEMIYGAPRGVEAPVLVDFWLENFKLHVGARSGQLHLAIEGEPPQKRRKVLQDNAAEHFPAGLSPPRDGYGMDVDQPLDYGAGFDDFHNAGEDINYDSRMRSSEEPGQARRGSRPPSALGSRFDFDMRPPPDIISGSQRSTLFPWDHAGPSSSSAAGGAGGFVAMGMGMGDGSSVFSAMRPASGGGRRGSSLGSRRESFLFPGGGTVPPSPVDFGLRNSLTGGEDFQFNVPDEETQEETQQSNILTLEKNSLNFLEYAKMQLRAFPVADGQLNFDEIVPQATSSRRVAAAAFYHCLVLSTKDLLGVRQAEPYGALKIRVK